jgi:2,3-bisphosphoglycerate-dependent phosphoglycerate mutase
VALRLLLIRHGRVDFDSRQFLETPRGRQWDPPLDERGRRQAEALSARLGIMERPSALFVSPFARCRQTAEPYLRAAGLDPEVVPDLGEVFIGEWEGLRFEEILSQDEDLARRFREQEAMFSLAPGGESGEQLRHRVVSAVEGLLDRIDGGTVVIVTHGGVINAYLGHIMAVPHDMFFLPENTSLNWVQVDGDKREMRFLNDVRHLTDPEAFVGAEPVPPPGQPAQPQA